MAQQPLLRLADPRVVARVRHHPRRRALEHDEPARHLGDLGHELERARARADHRDALAREVVLVLPLGRVEGRPGERLAPGNVGQPRPVELADRADDRVGLERLLAAADAAHAQLPARRGVVPARRAGPRCRSGCARARRTGPRSARSSRAARRAARRTPASRGWARTSSSRSGSPRRRGSRDSGSRTTCRRPPSFFSMHDVRDAGLLEPDRRQQARHAGADDDDVEALRAARPARRPTSTSRASPPSSAISSSIIGTYSSGTSSPTMKLIIRRIVAGDGGGGRVPPRSR